MEESKEKTKMSNYKLQRISKTEKYLSRDGVGNITYYERSETPEMGVIWLDKYVQIVKDKDLIYELTKMRAFNEESNKVKIK